MATAGATDEPHVRTAPIPQAWYPVRIQEDGLECVLVRSDVFDDMVKSSDWSDEEIRRMAERALSEADTAGPIPP